MTKRKYLIYVAGDMNSGWQDDLRAVLSDEIGILDPRSHGLDAPVDYTAWDLRAIRDSVAVIALMGPHNPSGYGLSLECGYAHALGRPIIFIDQLHPDWRSPYFGMLRSISTNIVLTVEEAARAIEARLLDSHDPAQ